MNLNYKTYGVGAPLVILHGLFGMLDNWSTLGRKFGNGYKVYLVDLRNHGKSPHNQVMNYPTMAKDIYDFIKANDLDKINLIGHSMGGKVAMQFAIDYPSHINKLVVADIGVKQYKGNHHDIFEAFESLDLAAIESRKQASEQLEKLLPDFGVRQFILKNLARSNDGTYFWRPAIQIIKNEYQHILAAVEGAFSGPALFVKGGQSKYIVESDTNTLLSQFPNATIQSIAGVGHWLHAEKPGEFYAVVNTFL